MSLVKVYKAGKSLRVTVPKAIYDQFVKINEGFRSDGGPYFVFRWAVRDYLDRITFIYEKYGYDFGLELSTGKEDLRGARASMLIDFGKTSKGISLPWRVVRDFNLSHGSKLQCDIITIDEPWQGCHNRVIAFKRYKRTRRKKQNVVSNAN